jgi:hypothetical protein
MAPRMPKLASPPAGRAPKSFDPNKAVLKPPRLRPASTRDYGKGGTPLSGSLFNSVPSVAGIGPGGPLRGV